jgi:hypothetical protein
MKTHLFASPEKITEGSEVTALCGKLVPNVVFMFRFSEGEYDFSSTSTLLLCKDCTQSIAGRGGKFYLYGINNGAKVREPIEAA